MRLIITIALAILWLLFGIFCVKPCYDLVHNCNDNSKGSETLENTEGNNPADLAATTKEVTGPILFNWNKEGPLINEGWDARRQAILDQLSDNEILEITGKYRADEENTTTFENLGLARAQEVAKLFKPPLTDDRMRLRGQLVNAQEGEKTSPFKSVEFRNLINTETIKEIDDKTVIRFPFNSVDKLNSADIEAYLNDVAERVIKSGEKVHLTGHTDNVDSEAFNLELGMRRANTVKDYLIGKGVSASQIIAISKGETEPVDTNDTRQGRANNRRTELQIIK